MSAQSSDSWSDHSATVAMSNQPKICCADDSTIGNVAFPTGRGQHASSQMRLRAQRGTQHSSARTIGRQSDGALLQRPTVECDCRLSRVRGRNDGACSGVREHGFDCVAQMFWPAVPFWLASPFMTSCPLTASWRAALAGPRPPAAPWAGRPARALRFAWVPGPRGPGLARRVPLRGRHPQDRRARRECHERDRRP